MGTNFCTNCGAPRADGAAFCPSCGAPANAAAPAQAAAPPHAPNAAPPGPQPYAAPMAQQPGAYGVQPPPAGGSGGMSRNLKIGIVIALVAAAIIAYLVRENEREFQRNRRAAPAPVATGTPAAPATPASGGGQGAAAPSQGADVVGSEAWTRTRLIGRWSTGNCATNTHIRIDGTTYSTNGNVYGRWSYANQRLTVVEPNATTELALVSLGDDEMVTEFRGRQQRWRRC